MSKNWVLVALFVWAVFVTVLLFRAQVSTNIENRRETEEAGSIEKDGPPDLRVVPINKVLAETVSISNGGQKRSYLDYYSSKIFHQESVYEKESCTMIMLTYRRLKTLPKLLSHYCKAKHLHKILVIWNDVGSEVPQNIRNLVNECEVPLQFIQEKENKLTNRFKPRPEIETECKLEQRQLLSVPLRFTMLYVFGTTTSVR